jgi:Icc protein
MRIVHISDFHLPARPDKQVNGVYPYENLKAAVEAIRRQAPRPDLIVLGGDFFEEGDKANYRTAVEPFETLQIPLHAVVGNHDHLPALKKSSGLPSEAAPGGYYSFDHGGHHVVILNSAGTGKPFGRLEEEQLLWLSADLHEHRFTPVLIFLHHPPFDTGVAWMDKIRLLNAESLWEIIPPFSHNILGIFVSHLHMAVTYCHRQVLLAGAPATCWQYEGNTDSAKAAISAEAPGFNLIDLAGSQVSVRTVRFAVAPPAAAGPGGQG